MIFYESAVSPSVRAGEHEVASRRIAARAFPYAGEAGGPRFRFDPVERRFFARAPGGTVLAGPHDPAAWRSALLRGLAGPVLVGPGSPAEEVRGSYLAAATGAADSGRAVYLLDPDPAGLPEPRGRCFTVLLGWFPGLGDHARVLDAARRRGIPAGWILPLVPGWTSDPGFIGETAGRAAGAGAAFLAGVALAEEGLARRIALEAAGASDPGATESLFDGIHHGGSDAEMREAREALLEACRLHGIAAVPPRPVGTRESPANAAAAARLEERALGLSGDEHQAALLLAAARWLDESGKDLAPVAREGNLPKVFPFGPELARAVEEALLGTE
jgi:hypothetical protein